MRVMIQIEAVNKVFHTKAGEVQALKNVSLHVKKGDIFGVIGYSGAGKSTLIRLVNLLEKPDSGKVRIEGREITGLSQKELNRQRKEIGMIFQQFNLLESQTVYQNIAIPLIMSKMKKEKIQARVKKLLSFVELEHKSKTYVSQLSGGQKQRIGIARALATDPKILLCDEATSALDPQTTESILQLLQRINRELNITILLITHEMNVIKKICNKVAVMKEGKICEQGETLQVFGSPKEEITKSFVGTVINSSIPELLRKDLEKNNAIIRITFLGEASKQSLISVINKQFEIETTILSASVNELQGKILGILILQIKGEAKEVKKAEQYIRSQNVKIERVSF
jgi:ABC-type metal ion transport system, ATPase component